MSAAPRQAEVLGGLLEDAAKEKGSLVVFDLDDTLLLTARRHLRILREYAQKREEAARLAELKPHHLRYGILDTAKDAGLSDEAILAELKDFWFKRFFTNEYLLEDAANEGAAAYCRDIRSAGSGVVYLTGRDEAMREGTLANLRSHGFPTPDAKDVHLMLKPRFDTPDHEFKDEAISRIKKMGRLAGSFENEPTHINLFHAAFPTGRHIFVDTKHSGKPVVPHPSLPWIKDFRRA